MAASWLLLPTTGASGAAIGPSDNCGLEGVEGKVTGNSTLVVDVLEVLLGFDELAGTVELVVVDVPEVLLGFDELAGTVELVVVDVPEVLLGFDELAGTVELVVVDVLEVLLGFDELAGTVELVVVDVPEVLLGLTADELVVPIELGILLSSLSASTLFAIVLTSPDLESNTC